MKSVLMLALLAGAPFVSSAAQAVVTPSHIYEFDGDARELRGGPTMVEGRNPDYLLLGRPEGGMRFGANQGPKVGGVFARPDVYSVEMFFSLDNLSNYRRVLDFKNGTEESGLYMRNGALAFYGPDKFDTMTIRPGEMIHVVLTRDAEGIVRGFANGSQRWSFEDSLDLAVFDSQYGLARFFMDDGREAASGFVDFIRLYDRVLSGAEVADLYNGGAPIRTFEAAAVPEPASWAMMIGGFALVGRSMRRHRTRVSFA